MSETAKHRHLVAGYCALNGVDLGSSGDPVVPWAIQVDLPGEQYHAYNITRPEAAIHWRGSALDLPFKDGTLDWCHASHLLEDYEDWGPPLREWDRVLKVGGFLIIAVPDHERFRAYVQRGREAGYDCDNMSHRRESFIGDIPATLEILFPGRYVTIRDGFVSESELEYSLLYVGIKRP